MINYNFLYFISLLWSLYFFLPFPHFALCTFMPDSWRLTPHTNWQFIRQFVLTKLNQWQIKSGLYHGFC